MSAGGDIRKHWDDLYRESDFRELSWFEERPVSSFRLLSKLGLPLDSAIVDIGAGQSYFIDDLVDAGYTNITAVDLSRTALEITSRRLGANAPHVRFITGNACVGSVLPRGFMADLWHDRACYHFLTDDLERKSYREGMLHHLKKGGYAILAEFSINSPDRCSGLNVRRFASGSIQEEFGGELELLEETEMTIPSSAGPRSYLYSLMKRRKQ